MCPGCRLQLSKRDHCKFTLFLISSLKELALLNGRSSTSQEWPVVLLKWKDKDSVGKANRLEVVDEFRTFVKPIWKPQLSAFCTALTGITQVCFLTIYISPYPLEIHLWLFNHAYRKIFPMPRIFPHLPAYSEPSWCETA